MSGIKEKNSQTKTRSRLQEKQIQEELQNREALIRCAQEFNLLGDPTRLKVCYLLCRHKELSVGEIARLVGVSTSAVSHTLKKLKQAKIVQSRRNFRHVYYHLQPSPTTKMLQKRLAKL